MKPEYVEPVIENDFDPEVCADIHSSGIGLAIVIGMVSFILSPPAHASSLSSSSMEIMEFIDKKVLIDYEGLVQASERYNDLSMTMNNIVTDFSSTSEELLASIQNMVQSITHISSAANDEATGATNIAQKTAEIAKMAENVVNLASSSKEKSESLIKLVNQFKI
ncbi:MAG: hypothetical protein ACFWTJ_04675 [Lachnoclostridium sp.]|jgi:methyl-accepting chemotaxis protein